MSKPLYDAYWVSPEGELFGVTRHIHFISSNLDKFGFTREHYVETFKKHNEKLGIEGKARAELIRDSLDKGWIRARDNGNEGWVIECCKELESCDENIKIWAAEVWRHHQVNGRYPLINVKINCVDIWISFEEYGVPETMLSIPSNLEFLATGVSKPSCPVRYLINEEDD